MDRIRLYLLPSVILASLLLVCCVEASTDEAALFGQSDRSLLLDSDGQLLKVTLRFSLWFPDNQNFDVYALSNDKENAILRSILFSTLDVICSEGDMAVQNANQIDECQTRPYQSTPTVSPEDALGQFGAPSVLSSVAEVIVRQIEGEGLVWSTWIVRYAVQQIGDLYVSEALMNQPELPFSVLADSAVEAMQQVLQLALDVSIMEGQFDTALRATMKTIMKHPVRVFSSTLRNEQEVFGDVKEGLLAANVYEFKRFSTMRLSGILVMLWTLLTYYLLNKLAARRRKALIRKERQLEAHRQETLTEPPLLASPEGVEKMLAQSSHRLQPDDVTTKPQLKNKNSSSHSVSSSHSTDKASSRSVSTSRSRRRETNVTASPSRSVPSSRSEPNKTSHRNRRHRKADVTETSLGKGSSARSRRRKSEEEDDRSVGDLSASVQSDGSVEFCAVRSNDGGQPGGAIVNVDSKSDSDNEGEQLMELPAALKLQRMRGASIS
jgi:hypothetical protein